MSDTRAHRPPTTRLVGGAICVYDTTGPSFGELAPVAVLHPREGDELSSYAVGRDLTRAYYATLDSAVCTAADGTELWRSDIEPKWSDHYGHRPSCGLSPDGRHLWLYQPDAMAGRGRGDRWTVLDAATGETLGGFDLETVGHGGVHLVHPGSGEVLLDVGEGQDGTVVFRGSFTDGTPELVTYPWTDRCLIDLSPDGRHFLTVDHGQGDLTVHAYPGGEAVFTVTVDDFGYDGEECEAVVEWTGGYLDPDTLAVVLCGEVEESGEEWFRSFRVDARTGRILGAFDSGAEDSYDLHPLGDGSWLTTADSGHPVRRTLPA
ncbi:hypothetical protein ACFY00_14870 [Kitasatospora sp. NPDC001540]|uniref:hypothetical protein n=1 Tax=Kitasatospora sp. NPDC001540 TaxID=3364014 RepID=UPI0036C7E81F